MRRRVLALTVAVVAALLVGTAAVVAAPGMPGEPSPGAGMPPFLTGTLPPGLQGRALPPGLEKKTGVWTPPGLAKGPGWMPPGLAGKIFIPPGLAEQGMTPPGWLVIK